LTGSLRSNPRFRFHKGDIFTSDDWLDEQVRDSDVVLPLIGVARPAFYIAHPLRTFELDFEQNLKMIRLCVKYGRRVLFPSTSEVYGMSRDRELQEDSTPLTVGPISKMRWIYSCSKQMMDRVITAYGQEMGLRYTLFRPFNWIGSRLDTFEDAKSHSARSVTQFIHDILTRRPIALVDGGAQRRSFTDVRDGVSALVEILRNSGDKADGEIFNIGNPRNNASIAEFLNLLINVMKENARFHDAAAAAVVKSVAAENYYGKGYEDSPDRVPSIRKIHEKLGWSPRFSIADALRRTLDDCERDEHFRRAFPACFREDGALRPESGRS
jgi:nucleoside-diphosphate-sugar epimerase